MSPNYNDFELQQFVKMSRYAGMREDLVQAGGGNSACKMCDDKMLIKASGFQLADVTEKSGYAVMKHSIVREAFLNCKELKSMTESDSKKIIADAFIEGFRPSIETFLHSITGKYSLHTHPIVVNAITCRKDGEKVLRQLFPEAMVISYATPGVELAKIYFSSYKEYIVTNGKEPECVFLMNHGLLVSGENADSVINITERVIRIIEEYLEVDNSSYHYVTALSHLYDNGVIWKVTDKNIIEAQKRLGRVWDSGFCPDCVVFLGKKMFEIKSKEINKEDFLKFVMKYGYPTIILYESNLYIHADSVKKAQEIQSVLSFSAQVMCLNAGSECVFLQDEEQNYLLDWDAEKYRREMK